MDHERGRGDAGAGSHRTEALATLAPGRKATQSKGSHGGAFACRVYFNLSN